MDELIKENQELKLALQSKNEIILDKEKTIKNNEEKNKIMQRQIEEFKNIGKMHFDNFKKEQLQNKRNEDMIKKLIEEKDEKSEEKKQLLDEIQSLRLQIEAMRKQMNDIKVEKEKSENQRWMINIIYYYNLLLIELLLCVNY